MSNQVYTLFGNQARQSILRGVKLVQRAAAVSLGPCGRNVAIEQEQGLPRVTKDGVTIVKSVEVQSRIEELGAHLIRQSSSQTNKFAGDGTTTSVILAAAIFESGQKYITAGYNPIFLARGLKEAKLRVLEYLEEIKTQVDDDQLLYNVAKVSSNYDPVITECVFQAISAVGKDGIVSIEPGGRKTRIVIQQGAQINRGIIHEKFIDDKGQLLLNYPFVLVSSDPITEIRQIVPVLELVKQTGQPLFIIAKDISPEVMSTLLFNHLKDIIRVGAITVPGFGDYSDDLLGDFASMIGSRIIVDVADIPHMQLSDLGQVVKIESNIHETFIIGMSGNSKQRMEKLQYDLSQEETQNQKQILKERLQRFNNQTAIIFAGGTSEAELHENRDKIVDSLNATKNTLSQGVLPGGGAALVHASKILDYLQIDSQAQLGVKLLQDALRQPIRILCQNANLNGGQVLKLLLDEPDYNIGYDLRRFCIGNMIDLGVVDSFQVVRQSLEDAVSLGSMLLTTEAAIVKTKSYRPPSLKSYKKDIF